MKIPTNRDLMNNRRRQHQSKARKHGEAKKQHQVMQFEHILRECEKRTVRT